MPRPWLFHVEWLGFRINWADRAIGAPVYLRVARADVVLHLCGHPTDGVLGSLGRAEVQGLPSLHCNLLRQPPVCRPRTGPGRVERAGSGNDCKRIVWQSHCVLRVRWPVRLTFFA